MKKFEIKIKGNRPVIYNRIKKEIQDELKEVKKNELAEWQEKNWIKKAEIKNGNAILPSEWIHSMIINACKQTKKNPHFATSKKETYTRYMQNVLIPQNPPIIFDKKEKLEPYNAFLKSQPTNYKSGKILKYFPMLKNWDAVFIFVDPIGRIKKSELKYLFEYGGLFLGIGDLRKQGFGRFDVEYIKEVN